MIDARVNDYMYDEGIFIGTATITDEDSMCEIEIHFNYNSFSGLLDVEERLSGMFEYSDMVTIKKQIKAELDEKENITERDKLLFELGGLLLEPSENGKEIELLMEKIKGCI